MPAQSQQQQKLFGLALAFKRGEVPASEVSDEIKDIADRMSEKEIEDFASTKHKGLPKMKEQLRKIVREIMREKVISEMESVNEVDTKKADMIRKSMPGFVGPKFANKASDEDILAMADLKDEHAKIYNRYMKDINDKISKLQKKYRIKESVNEGALTEEKYTIIDPKGNPAGTGTKDQANQRQKKLGGSKKGYFVVPAKKALKARRTLEKYKFDFKNTKLQDLMSDLYFEGVDESVNEGYSTEEKRIVMMAVRKLAKYRNVPLTYAINDLLGAGQELERDIKRGKITK